MRTRVYFITTFILTFIYMSSHAQDHTIKVVGQASLRDIPENILLEVPVEVIDSIFQNCSDKLILKLNQLKTGLNKIGINPLNIKTDNFSIRENYEYNKESERVRKGYRGIATIRLQEKHSVDLINKIISLLKESQLTYNIDFALSETQKTELTAAAINNAISDAKAKANIIAKASGVKLKEILKIIYDYSGEHDMLLRFDDYERDDTPALSASLLLFNPSEININKYVQIEWILEN